MSPAEFGLGTVFGLAAAGYVFLKTFMVTKDHLARLGGGYDVLFLSTAVGVGLGLLLPVYTAFVAPPFGKLLAESIPGLEPLMATTWESARNSPFRLSQHALIIAGMIVAMLELASMLNLHLIAIPGADRIRTYCIRQASLRRGDLLQIVLDDSLMVELALRGGKSYMGLPVKPFYPVPGAEGSAFVRIVPIFSGYRSGKKWLLKIARYYGDEIGDLIENGQPVDSFMLVVSAEEIVSARPFDPKIYAYFNADELSLPSPASSQASHDQRLPT